MEYVQLSMDEYIRSKNDIKNNLGGIVKSFVRIGWQLTRIDQSEAYKNDGYSSINEFAASEYGMNRSGVSRFMKVYKTYSVDGDTPELKEQYRDFKFSQLVELTQIQETDRQMFAPEVKREDIREFQRFEKENESTPDNLLNWKEAKSPEEKLRAAIQEFCRENKEVLDAVYEPGTTPKALAELISPSGSRSYRKGTVYLMFYEETKGIMVKVFGETPVDITYKYLLDTIHGMFDGYNAGTRTWEKCFGKPDSNTEKEVKEEEPTESIEEGQKKTPDIKTGLEQRSTDENLIPKEYRTHTCNEQKSQEKAVDKESEQQIPGQDSIEQHPEYLPEPLKEPEKEPTKEQIEQNEIAPAQPEGPVSRKEYLETLTMYGLADYLAGAMASFGNVSWSSLKEVSFWEAWLSGKVDKKGRPWIN